MQKKQFTDIVDIAHFVCGKMNMELSYPHHIAWNELEKIYHSLQGLLMVLSLICENYMFCEKALIFITNAEPFLVKIAISLEVFYLNLMTRLANVLHRVVEQNRENCETVNKIISCVNKIFLKTPMRVKDSTFSV